MVISEDPTQRLRQWTIDIYPTYVRDKVVKHLKEAKAKGILDLAGFRLKLKLHEAMEKCPLVKCWNPYVYGLNIGLFFPLSTFKLPKLDALAVTCHNEDQHDNNYVSRDRKSMTDILQAWLPKLNRLQIKYLYFKLPDLPALTAPRPQLQTLVLLHNEYIGNVTPVLNLCQNITKLEVRHWNSTHFVATGEAFNLELPALKHLTINNNYDGFRFLRDNATRLESLMIKESDINEALADPILLILNQMDMPVLKTFICLDHNLGAVVLHVVRASVNSLERLVYCGRSNNNTGLFHPRKLKQFVFSLKHLEPKWRQRNMALISEYNNPCLEQVAFYDVTDDYPVTAFKHMGYWLKKVLGNLKEIGLFVDETDAYTDLGRMSENGARLKDVYQDAAVRVGKGSFLATAKQVAITYCNGF